MKIDCEVNLDIKTKLRDEDYLDDEVTKVSNSTTLVNKSLNITD